MKRKIKLDVVMKSGTVVRAHVTEYAIGHRKDGSIETFKWNSLRRHGRGLATIQVSEIDCIVMVSR